MPSTPSPYVYDQIIIGSGSAAAMYLNTLRNYFKTTQDEPMPAAILVIGMGDPWAGTRGYEKGHYTENINQARQLFEHGTGARASMDIDPVDRTEWAGTNAGIIREVSQGHSVQAEVTDVSRHLTNVNYVVKTTGGIFQAKKVVIASGGGIETSDREYHTVPGEVKAYKETHGANSRIMDLDQFQNGAEGSRLGRGKKVAVIGENAGTDAIMEAATRNYAVKDVYWFMPNTANPGTALTWDISRLNPTFTAETAGKNKGPRGDEGCVVRTRSTALSPTGGGKVRVTHDAGTVDVDYFVYAKGQFGGGVKRAVSTQSGMENVPFVNKGIVDKLEPVYDVNQRYTDLDNGGAWQHVVGVQLKGTTATRGISLVGSAAVQVGRDVDHNYLDKEFFDFCRKLHDITTNFETVARNNFSELYAFPMFSKMIDNGKIQALSTESLKLKKEVYITRVRQLTDAASIAVTGASVSEMRAVAKQRSAENEAFAKELCYLFELRVKAAQYYTQRKTAEGRNPERVDSMQHFNSPQRSSNGLVLQPTIPETISDGRLLGGMQRNIAAVNNSHNVSHIVTEKGNNFMEDQQSLALYVAVHYPNIKDVDANRLVEEIVAERKNKGRGFTPQEMGAWDFKLGQKERESRPVVGYAYKTYFNHR